MTRILRSNPVTHLAPMLALCGALGAEAATVSTIQFNTARASSLALGTIQDVKIGFFVAAPTASIARDALAPVDGTTFREQAFVEVDASAIRARGSLSAVAGASAVSYLSQVTAAVQDGFRIDSTLYDGQLARVEYTLDVSGLLAPALDAGAGTLALAGSSWRVSSGCQSILQCGQVVYTGSATQTGGVLTAAGDEVGLLSFVLDVRFGTVVNLLTTLDLTNQLLFGDLATGVGAEGIAGTASADFASTVTWSGIRRVALADGTLVTDWTTTSGSSFDYGSASVVPVPGALWLMGSALAGLGALRAARRPST